MKQTDEGYNIILQENTNRSEEGSLSAYCNKNKMSYVNCETEYGKKEQYLEMIKAFFVPFMLILIKA